MSDFAEKRETERFACEYPILCSSLNGTSVYPAVTVDIGENGIGFFSRTPMKSGTTLYFRADPSSVKRPDTVHCRGLKGTGLIEVRWCAEEKVPGQERRFRIGAHYIDLYP